MIGSFLSKTCEIAILLALSSLAHAETSAVGRYRVTLQNVTAANGISPFLVAVLKPTASLFTVGQPASAGIAAVAETGNTGPLESELAANDSVVAVAKAPGGPIPAGQTRVLEFTVSEKEINHGAILNLVGMIGRSNDSFVSLRGLHLSVLQNAQPIKVTTTNYDAGSEENTGNVEDFGAGGHPTSAAEGHMSADRGLNSRGNAPEILGWGPVAAVVTLERI